MRPHPYSKKGLQSYIQDYLEQIHEYEAIEELQLERVQVNVLSIERTFIDKLMAVKRHAICGTLRGKVRHIYDVVKLSEMKEIEDFLNELNTLKDIIRLTKQTDLIYLKKRDIPNAYNPLGPYGFSTWKDKFTDDIKENYESLHENLLFTDQKQDWSIVELVFDKLNQILIGIDE